MTTLALDTVRYLYCRNGLSGQWDRHAVVRIAPKHIYIEFLVGPPLRLDRAHLERHGWAPAGQRYWGLPFFVEPDDHHACLRRLGLSWPTTAAQVRRAYRRLARSSHPDAGGREEEFVELVSAYEQALRLVAA